MFCECGCGRRTKLAPRNNAKCGWVKGLPLRFVKGHSGHKNARVRDVEPPNPSGVCKCGCGEKTSIAPRTDTARGHVKGEAMAFIFGHQNRGKKRPIRERVEACIERLGADDCWLWTGTLNDGGYGRIYVEGRLLAAHRVVYELYVGPIPKGCVLDHLCRNPACVRPSHVEPVTDAENQRRGLKGVLKTHCKHGHPWTEQHIGVRPNGARYCRMCWRHG